MGIPSFLNPWTALAAAAVVVPSLLLLYFLKLRRREVPISSTLLWKKAIQDLQVNAPFQRLRKNLLLLLQLLLLAALLMALARPVANYTPGAGELSVILIDRSASMAAKDQPDGRSRLDEAKRQAKEVVDTLGKNARAMVIAFDDSADVVRGFESDRMLLRDAIDAIQPTHRKSKLRLAYQLAEAKAAAFYVDQLRPSGPGPELWLFSDGRVSDGEELSLRQATLKEFRKIGSDDAKNLAVVSLSAKRNYERPTEVQLFARLANFGPEPAKAVLQLSIDGQVPPGGVKRDLLLLPERWSPDQREKAEKDMKLAARDSADFKFELMKEGVVKIELKELANDCLAADDSAQVIVPPPRSMRVALVSTTGNYYLEKFLQSANLRDPQVLAPADFEKKMADPQALAAEYDVILFDRYQPMSLPPLGNFIYFNAVPPESKLVAASTGAGQVELKDHVVLDWERGHPILRGLNLRFYAAQSLKLQVPLEAQTLVDGRQGPLIVLYKQGRTTHLVIGFDVLASSWPLSPTFPIFLDHAMQFLALGSEMDVRQWYPPGSTPRLPRYALQQAGGQLSKLTVNGPASFGAMTVNILPTGDFALPPLEKVGVYKLDPPVPGFEKLSVNLLDENESNLIARDHAPGSGGETVAATSGGSRMDLWWWIVLCGAIPLCLIEWWVYTRRMHL